MEEKIILYHSNEENKCKEFIEKGNSLLLSGNLKDDIWLGKGMYFGDNRGNANWWKRKQCDKHPNAKYGIVAVNAILDNLLDLTDYDIYMKLDELWKQICQLSDLNSNVPLGEKLNFCLTL